jgi:hypothetical protein
MKWWNSYWFRPAPLLDLAIVRIVAVALQLSLLWWVPGRVLYDAVVQENAVPDALFAPLPALKVLLLPFGWGYRPSLDALVVVYYVTSLAGVLALLGLRTNFSLLVFALGNLMLTAFVYSFGEMHHGQAVMMVALSVLALSPCGQVLSVDAWLRRRSKASAEPGYHFPELLEAESPFARWPILLIQWFFVLMYLSAVYSKMANSGLEWMNGYTLQYYLAVDSMRWDSPLATWLSQHHLFIMFVQWVVMLFQATFWLAVIYPRLRWIYVPLGLSFHVGILLTLKAPFYEWIGLYVVFVPWTYFLKSWWTRSRLPTTSPA